MFNFYWSVIPLFQALVSCQSFETNKNLKLDISGDITENFDKESADTHCICLPYWECKDVNHAKYKDDFSLSEVRNNENNQNSLSVECSGYLDVCCKVKCGIQYSIAGQTENMHKRILGDADIAEFGEFPWMLGILEETVYKCGGSLIHPKVSATFKIGFFLADKPIY